MTKQPQADQENFVCPHKPVFGARTFGDWERLGPPTLNTNIPVRYEIQKPDYEAAYHKLARLVCIAWTHLYNGNSANCLETLEKCGEMIKDVETPKTVFNAEAR